MYPSVFHQGRSAALRATYGYQKWKLGLAGAVTSALELLKFTGQTVCIRGYGDGNGGCGLPPSTSEMTLASALLLKRDLSD